MKQITYLFSIFLFFFALNAYCQNAIDVVYSKNGSIIKGKINEQVPNQSIKIKTRAGSIFVYKYKEIEKMLKENVGEDDAAFSISKPQTNGFIGTLSVGLGFFLGDIDPENYRGGNIGGSAGYVFSNNFGARLDFAMHSFGLDNPVQFTTLRGDFLIGYFKKESKVVPYGLLGLGMYFRSSNVLLIDSLGNDTSTESEFGLGLGGGVGFKVYKKAAIFLETQYNIGFGKYHVSSFLPIKIGIMITP